MAWKEASRRLRDQVPAMSFLHFYKKIKNIFYNLGGGKEFRNRFNQNVKMFIVHIFKAFCLTLVKKNCQIGEGRKITANCVSAFFYK